MNNIDTFLNAKPYLLTIVAIFLAVIFFFWNRSRGRKRIINYEIQHVPLFDGKSAPEGVEIFVEGMKAEKRLYYCKGSIVNNGQSDIAQPDFFGDGEFKIVCPIGHTWLDPKIEDPNNSLKKKGHRVEGDQLILPFDLFKTGQRVNYEGYYYANDESDLERSTDKIDLLKFEFKIRDFKNVRTVRDNSLEFADHWFKEVLMILGLLLVGLLFCTITFISPPFSSQEELATKTMFDEKIEEVKSYNKDDHGVTTVTSITGKERTLNKEELESNSFNIFYKKSTNSGLDWVFIAIVWLFIPVILFLLYRLISGMLKRRLFREKK